MTASYFQSYPMVLQDLKHNIIYDGCDAGVRVGGYARSHLKRKYMKTDFCTVSDFWDTGIQEI